MALYNIPIGFKIFPIAILQQKNDTFTRFTVGSEVYIKIEVSFSTCCMLVLLEFGDQSAGGMCQKAKCIAQSFDLRNHARYSICYGQWIGNVIPCASLNCDHLLGYFGIWHGKSPSGK